MSAHLPADPSSRSCAVSPFVGKATETAAWRAPATDDVIADFGIVAARVYTTRAYAAELGASDDALTQMLWRQVRAKVLARRGEHAEAELLAREAVAIGEETDMLDAQGDVYADLAEVLLLAAKPDEAAAALEQALARYERKGNLVSTQRAQTRLAELRAAAPR